MILSTESIRNSIERFRTVNGIRPRVIYITKAQYNYINHEHFVSKGRGDLNGKDVVLCGVKAKVVYPPALDGKIDWDALAMFPKEETISDKDRFIKVSYDQWKNLENIAESWQDFSDEGRSWGEFYDSYQSDIVEFFTHVDPTPQDVEERI